MAIEQFTQAHFEECLPKHKQTNLPIFEYKGIVQNEYIYLARIDSQVGILLRSSIDPRTGVARDTAKDSIRAMLVSLDNMQPLGSKANRWTTRLPGWGDRVKGILRTLWGWRLKSGDCPCCGQPLKVFKVKKAGANKGRIFARCEDHSKQTWQWLTEVK